MAVWRQTEGLGSGAPWAGKPNTTAEGTPEEGQPCRRHTVPPLGRVRGGGEDGHGNPPAHVHTEGSQRVGRLWHRLWVAKGHLLGPWETGRLLCMLQVARHLLCGLKGIGG